MKSIIFKGTSLDDLRDFPINARREAGFQLDKVQQGLSPSDWKPMSSVGQGVQEIRIKDHTGAYRVIYIATLPDAIYVLTAFVKKQQKTPSKEIERAKKYYKELKNDR